MTTDEMIAHLSSLLGKIGTILDAEILLELQNAQTELEGGPLLPWFLLKEKTTTVTVGEPRILVPTDFLREAEDSALYYVDSDGAFNALTKGHQDTLRVYWNRRGTEDADTSGPRAYALVNNYFFIYPTPAEAHTLRMYYYAADTALAAGDTGNLWSTHYPNLLMGKAGMSLCLHYGTLQDGNTGPYQAFSGMATRESDRLLREVTAREMAGMEMSYGGG